MGAHSKGRPAKANYPIESLEAEIDCLHVVLLMSSVKNKSFINEKNKNKFLLYFLDNYGKYRNIENIDQRVY